MCEMRIGHFGRYMAVVACMPRTMYMYVINFAETPQSMAPFVQEYRSHDGASGSFSIIYYTYMYHELYMRLTPITYNYAYVMREVNTRILEYLLAGVKRVLKFLVRVLSYYSSEYPSEYEYLFSNHCHTHTCTTLFVSRVSQANLLPRSSITPFHCAIEFVLPPDTKTLCVF